MKISVSLGDEDLRFLDDYAQANGMRSRSATVRRAVRLLRASHLEDDYAEAFQEWTDSGEAEVWETVAGDGLVSE
ncbi:MAG: ribbon-helix-helix domain-containing protein [bacterium]|nr:ribbon-helix-helix domain-containing protein [bacterium]